MSGFSASKILRISESSGIYCHGMYQAVTLVENRRIFGGNVIDFGEFVDFFDRFGFARHDQADVALVTLGGGEQIIERLVLMPPEFLW